MSKDQTFDSLAPVEWERAAGRISSNKYHARAVTVDGIRFASKLEAQRYGELKLLERAGEIDSLQCHPKYRLALNGVLICHYTADFKYRQGTAFWIVEDVKSGPTRTRDYVLRKKLMLALHGIDVKEYPPPRAGE